MGLIIWIPPLRVWGAEDLRHPPAVVGMEKQKTTSASEPQDFVQETPYYEPKPPEPPEIELKKENI